MEMVGRDVHLRQKRLGMDRHFDLASHGFAQFTAIGNDHRQRHAVVLDQGRQRVDRHANRGVLHDDRGPFAPHPGASAKAHAFVFLVGWNVKDIVAIFDLINHAGKLFAGHGGDE